MMRSASMPRAFKRVAMTPPTLPRRLLRRLRAWSAYGAGRVAADLHFAERHRRQVAHQQLADQRVPQACEHLDRLHRAEAADGAGDRAEDGKLP